MSVFRPRNDLGQYIGSSVSNDYYVQLHPTLGPRYRMVEGSKDSEYQSYGSEALLRDTSTASPDVRKFMAKLALGPQLAYIAGLI